MPQLPGVTAVFPDGGLAITPPQADVNSSILIIGTAEDGPMYEPVAIDNLATAATVFGRFGKGTLVRGIHEAWYAAGGTRDIRALRIGDGMEAILEIPETTSGSGVSAAQSHTQASLKLKALYPGDIYNDVTVGLVDGKVGIYNPKSGKWSLFSYDTSNIYADVDVHNVAELVDAINADPNLNSILVASYDTFHAAYEVALDTSSSGVVVNDSLTEITLKDLFSADWMAGGMSEDGVQPTGFYTGETPTVSQTAGNRIAKFNSVYSISESQNAEGDDEIVSFNGGREAWLTKPTLDAKRSNGELDTRFRTIQCLDKYCHMWDLEGTNADSSGFFWVDPSGTPRSEVVERVRGLVCTLSGQMSVPDGLDTTGTKAWRYYFDAELCPDDWNSPGEDAENDETYHSRGALVTAAYTDGTNILGVGDGYPDAGYLTRLTAEGRTAKPDGDWVASRATPIRVKVDGIWAASGDYLTTLEWDATNKRGSFVLLPSGNLYESQPQTVEIYYDSVKGHLTEAKTLAELENSDSWKTFFTEGQKLILGAAPKNDLYLNYGVKIDYEEGTNFEVLNANTGHVRFTDPSGQPGPAASGLVSDTKSIIGFDYEYMPEWPNITSTFDTMAGGRNGDNPTNAVLHSELAIAYEKLQDYEVDIIVPMGAHLDATMEGYNSITGLLEEKNCGFHTQLAAFLEGLPDGTGETMGIIGVEPAKSASLSDVKEWVDRLTITDPGDELRGANFMSVFSSKLISVVAFEPIFQNPHQQLIYTANGAAAYAGLVSALEPHVSPTNKSIGGVGGLRYSLSSSQLERLLNSRYVTMRQRPGRIMVVTDAITAAAPGSDYVFLSTWRIVAAAMKLVRTVCNPFIGMPNTLENRNAIDTAVSAGLQSMVDGGALTAFDFTVSSTPAERTLGNVNIEMILVPVFEMRRIRVTVKLKPSL